MPNKEAETPQEVPHKEVKATSVNPSEALAATTLAHELTKPKESGDTTSLAEIMQEYGLDLDNLSENGKYYLEQMQKALATETSERQIGSSGKFESRKAVAGKDFHTIDSALRLTGRGELTKEVEDVAKALLAQVCRTAGPRAIEPILTDFFKGGQHTLEGGAEAVSKIRDVLERETGSSLEDSIDTSLTLFNRISDEGRTKFRNIENSTIQKEGKAYELPKALQNIKDRLTDSKEEIDKMSQDQLKKMEVKIQELVSSLMNFKDGLKSPGSPQELPTNLQTDLDSTLDSLKGYQKSLSEKISAN